MSWAMVQHMHQILFNAIRVVITTYYISLICDEVSTIHYHRWVFLYAYVVQN